MREEKDVVLDDPQDYQRWPSPNGEVPLAFVLDLEKLSGYFVYYLYEGNEVVYVGFSSNILARLGVHLSPGKRVGFDAKRITKVFVLKFSDRTAALSAETKAIVKHEPRYNCSDEVRHAHEMPTKTRHPGLGVDIADEIIEAYLNGWMTDEIADNFRVSLKSVRRLFSSVSYETKQQHRTAAINRLTGKIAECTNPAKLVTLRRKRAAYASWQRREVAI
jgi:predicted GIY-YIG superfamily endonuclease